MLSRFGRSIYGASSGAENDRSIWRSSSCLRPSRRGCLFLGFPVDGRKFMETKFDPKDAFERKPRIVGVVASPADWELVTRSGFSELDLCELRMDLLTTEQIQPNEYLKPLPLPKILTIRDPREGGKESLTENERLRLFGELLPHVDYIDIELRNLGLYAEVIAGARDSAKQIIVSVHD